MIIIINNNNNNSKKKNTFIFPFVCSADGLMYQHPSPLLSVFYPIAISLSSYCYYRYYCYLIPLPGRVAAGRRAQRPGRQSRKSRRVI